MIASGRARYSDAEARQRPRARSIARRSPSVGTGPAAGGAVLVATGTEEDERAAHRLRALVLLAAAIAAAVLAVGIALLLTRRALRPLTDLSAAARAIGDTGDATRRLPPADARDEVGALSETLNAMLASLEQAREAERRFVADASHELRTPLTALRGNAAYIAQHGADAEVLADIEGDAARLARLLDELLALAREDAAGPGRAEPVRLDQLALDARRRTGDGRCARPRHRPRGPGRARSRARQPGRERARCTGPRAAPSGSPCARSAAVRSSPSATTARG